MAIRFLQHVLRISKSKIYSGCLSNSVGIYVLQIDIFTSQSSLSNKPICSNLQCNIGFDPSHHKGPAAAIPSAGPLKVYCLHEDYQIQITSEGRITLA